MLGLVPLLPAALFMAAKRTPAPPRSKRTARHASTPRKKQMGQTSRYLRGAILWLYRVARPRSAPESVALMFVLAAVGMLAVLLIRSLQQGTAPGPGLAWVVTLALLAVASRLSPWWKAEFASMTGERARRYTGASLSLFVILSVSWHMLSTSLGLGSVYLLMGPMDREPAAVAVLVTLALLAAVLLFDIPLLKWLNLGARALHLTIIRLKARRVVALADVEDLPVFESEEIGVPSEPFEPKRNSSSDARPIKGAVTSSSLPAKPANLPSIETFRPAPKGQAAPLDVELNSRRIEETFASFNVGARVVGHHCGPVVTQFDVQPDRGVKVRRITELQNDLALALAAPTIRIQAPVPGKPVVGIEIPNASATMVALRELLESESYRALHSPLKVALGKDVAGNPAVIDLAKMPHLLIAGATGSGKSVCVNALISCLLYQNTPEQVRLMLVDPKMVELTVYNGVPHLLSPVVTEMDKVVGVLQWALREMERRYQLFASNTVRNIQRFNEKMEANGLKRLPYLVLVIDELADLMMVSPDDVEEAICRLAQLARAAGIHLVIATQRPSVDVITGLIKANFPARIAFAMTSQVDSRTILDTAGAEKLLGRGDMLYMPPDAPKPVRLQGAFLSDQEIEELVEFWQQSPLQIAAPTIPAEEFLEAEKEAKEVTDELLEEAIRVVREYQHASVSLLQRRLRVGYSRAARLMDQLESRNVVGPADGSKQRPVLDESSPSAP